MKTDKFYLVKICKKFLISYFSDGYKKSADDLQEEIAGGISAALAGLVQEGKITEFSDINDVDGIICYQQARAKNASDKLFINKYSPEALKKRAEREKRKKWLAVRRIDMAIQRLNGDTLKKISDKYSISPEVVRQQVSKAYRIVRSIYADKIKKMPYSKQGDKYLLDFLIDYKKSIQEQNEN
jgi:DNA-binding CsgD family transcriptional regulator